MWLEKQSHFTQIKNKEETMKLNLISSSQSICNWASVCQHSLAKCSRSLRPTLPLCLYWEAEWWCLLTAVTLDITLKEGNETATSPLWQRNLVHRRQGIRPDTSHPAWRVLCIQEGRKTGRKVGFLNLPGKGDATLTYISLWVFISSPGVLESNLVSQQ